MGALLLGDEHGTMSPQARARGQEGEVIMSAMTTSARTATAMDERMYLFPPFPATPEGVTIVPFSTFSPVGYRCVSDASGHPIEVDAWAEIPTIKVLNEEEASQKRRAKKKRRNAGNAVDAEGRLIPWWEEWEEGETERAMSVPSLDRCGIFVSWITSESIWSTVR